VFENGINPKDIAKELIETKEELKNLSE